MTRPLRAGAALSVLSFGAIAIAACSAGPPPAKAPSAAQAPADQFALAAPQAPAGGVDGAVAELARAEDEMQRALAVAGGAPVASPERAPAQQAPGPRAEPGTPPPAPPPNGASKAPSKHAEEERADALSASDACSVACRALESMRRSTDQLCGLAGAGDARCVDANARVDRAQARVRASCPACAR
ncbi:MAG: hypothetical protein WKG00_27655 [Polyangiaceae bacterium]